MIRINLLGVPKAKRGKRPSTPISAGEGPSTAMLLLVFVIVLGAGLWGWYTLVDRQRDTLRADLKKEQDENTKLSDVKSKYEAAKKKADQFEQRARIIHQLGQQQTGPVNLLNMVADTITKTDAVWLDAMTDDGRSIDFTGFALSPDAVANLMANLDKTGRFKSVEIKETAQDSSIKELQAFKFELVCEKLTPGSSATAPAAAKTEKKG
ncbi:MAG TPA: PilN domain-containing protein [Candidatus Angelobacter sp.]